MLVFLKGCISFDSDDISFSAFVVENVCLAVFVINGLLDTGFTFKTSGTTEL